MTGIVRTDRTWNPITGCDRVSEGCDNRYALTMASRLKAMGQRKYQRDGDSRTSGPGFRVTVHPAAVNEPLRWRKPSMVFVNSMSDLFHADVPSTWLADIFAVMAAARRHTFQVLTKRPARMRSMLTDPWMAEAVKDRSRDKGLHPTDWVWPLPNVWLGVSVEDQRWADIRIPALLDTPAAVRWVSAEPLLASLSLLEPYLIPGPDCPCEKGAPMCDQTLDWVVVGGESGPGARPMRLDWVEQIVADCQAAGVPVLVKQLGTVTGGRSHQDITTFPAALRVREYPTTLKEGTNQP